MTDLKIKEVYKCRMCGQQFSPNAVYSIEETAKITAKRMQGNAELPHEIHHCFGNDKVIGVADWIGWAE